MPLFYLGNSEAWTLSTDDVHLSCTVSKLICVGYQEITILSILTSSSNVRVYRRKRHFMDKPWMLSVRSPLRFRLCPSVVENRKYSPLVHRKLFRRLFQGERGKHLSLDEFGRSALVFWSTKDVRQRTAQSSFETNPGNHSP